MYHTLEFILLTNLSCLSLICTHHMLTEMQSKSFRTQEEYSIEPLLCSDDKLAWIRTMFKFTRFTWYIRYVSVGPSPKGSPPDHKAILWFKSWNRNYLVRVQQCPCIHFLSTDTFLAIVIYNWLRLGNERKTVFKQTSEQKYNFSRHTKLLANVNVADSMPHQHLKGSFCRVHLWGGHSSICFSASSFSSSWLLGYLPSEIQARGGHHSFSDTSLFLFLPMTLQKLYQLQKTRKQGYCYWVEGVALCVNRCDVGDLESQAIENHASRSLKHEDITA